MLCSDSENPTNETMRVDRLHLAAWLRLNKQRMVRRELLPDGRVAYYFEPSEDLPNLVAFWCSQTAETGKLSSFARIVSHEIRVACRLRRERVLEERATTDVDAVSDRS